MDCCSIGVDGRNKLKEGKIALILVSGGSGLGLEVSKRDGEVRYICNM